MKKHPNHTLHFSGDPWAHLGDLELLRQVQAYCAHDLRSTLGATAGLLQIIAEDTKLQAYGENPNFQAAVSSAQEALASLDKHLPAMRPEFKVAWLLSEKEPQGSVKSDGLPRLFVRFDSVSRIMEHVPIYRPHVLIIDAELAGPQLRPLIKRVGPQLVRILISGKTESELPSAVLRLQSPELSWSEIHRAWDELDAQ